jgi:hypothetical protein
MFFIFKIDIYKKSGHSRSVDWIDFLKFILPTLVVEALQLQKRDVIRKETSSRSPTMTEEQLLIYGAATDDACKAIVCLSKACRISQKYSISESDLIELNRYANEYII